MHPQIAFILYLAVGCILIFTFLLLCVRVSVYIEDTCPTRFCVRRQQRKMRKKLIRRILYPDEPDTDTPRPASPSEDNITADIICRPYIYRDAYSTGLTGLGRTLESGAPLTETEGHYTSNSVYITNHRIIFRRMISPQILAQLSPVNDPISSLGDINLEGTGITNSDDPTNDPRLHEHEEGAAPAYVEILPPPAYSNILNLDSVNVMIEDETGSGDVGGSHHHHHHHHHQHVLPLPPDSDMDSDEPPPPSYDECVKQLPDFNSGLVTTIPPPPPPPPPQSTQEEGS